MGIGLGPGNKDSESDSVLVSGIIGIVITIRPPC